MGIDLTSRVAMSSGVPSMDKYVQQNYLDNVLRGGMPSQTNPHPNPHPNPNPNPNPNRNQLLALVESAVRSCAAAAEGAGEP